MRTPFSVVALALAFWLSHAAFLPSDSGARFANPVGGEVYVPGSTQNVVLAGTSLSSGTHAVVQLSRDGGKSYQHLGSAVVPEGGLRLNWPVSGPSSDECRLRATLSPPTPTGAKVAVICSGTFSIGQAQTSGPDGFVMVSDGNGGVVWVPMEIVPPSADS